MSSQDGSNRSQRNRRTSGQPRPSEPNRRQNQTWDVDPAEIDRYLSGRPSRAEDAPNRSGRRGSSGETADQLSRLQNAVGRRRTEPRNTNAESYRLQPTRRERVQTPPAEPEAYYEDQATLDDGGIETGGTDSPGGYEYDDQPWDEPAPTPRTPPRRSTPRTTGAASRPARRYEPEPAPLYDDPDYDEELYNDDPYLGYEDERLDRRPPRTRRPRQQTKMSRPNMPKVTIPAAFSDSPLLADRRSLIMIGVALLSVALMSFVVSDRIGLLGDTIPTHVSANGDPENIKTRDAVWNIPLLAGMVMLMNIAASWFISRIDQFASRFLLAAGLLVHFIAWVAIFKYLWG